MKAKTITLKASLVNFTRHLSLEQLGNLFNYIFAEANGVSFTITDPAIAIVFTEVKKGIKAPPKKQEEITARLFDIPKAKVDLLTEFLEYRVEIKKPIKSQKALDSLVNKFKENSLDCITYVVNASISNQWQGLFWDKYQPVSKPSAAQKIYGDDYQDMLNLVKGEGSDVKGLK